MMGIRMSDRTVMWLAAVLVGVAAGYTSGRLQGGACGPQHAGRHTPVVNHSPAVAEAPSTGGVPAASGNTAVTGDTPSQTGMRAAPSVLPAGGANPSPPPAAALEAPRRPSLARLPASPVQPVHDAARAGHSLRPASADSGSKGDGPSVAAAAMARTFQLFLDAITAAVSAEQSVLERAADLTKIAGPTITAGAGGPRAVPPTPPASISRPRGPAGSPTTTPPPPDGAARAPFRSGAPRYQVTGGPLYKREQVEDVVRQLIEAGLAPKISTAGQDQPLSFRVGGDNLLASVAQHRAAGLADLHPDFAPLDNGRVRLQFGVFASEREARALAERIRRRGYPVTVAQTGGTAYMITVTLSRPGALDASVGIIKTAGAGVPVRVSELP